MKHAFISAALSAGLAFAALGEAMSPRELLRLGADEVAAGGEMSVRGVVTFVSGIDPRFVVAPQDNPRHAGVMILCGDGVAAPENGDLVLVSGKVVRHDSLPALDASRVDVIRRTTLPLASGAKQSDFRRGLLFNRRVSLSGKALGMRGESTTNGAVTVMGLELDNYIACVRIPGEVDANGVVGETVRVTGLAVNRHADDGLFLDAELEVSGVDAIDIIETNAAAKYLIVAACVLGAVVLFFIGMSLFLWRRGVRIRREAEVVAAERRRMAADLHDTIEQHLAAVKILLTCAVKPEGVPEETKKVLEKAAAMLIHAKGEIRSTIMDLRSDGQEEKGLETHIREMAIPLRHGGVSVRSLLRGVPAKLGSARFGDLLLIVREAVTNAVKHGKARTVVIVSDPMETGSGFVLKVLNDGAPFDFESALGPETGHFGLFGMRERALRSCFGLEFGRDGKWTVVRLEVPS